MRGFVPCIDFTLAVDSASAFLPQQGVASRSLNQYR